MAKPTYLVTVIRKGREQDYGNSRKRRTGGADEALCFVEPVRASNRREALVLVRARSPDHLLDAASIRKHVHCHPWRRASRDAGCH